MSTNMVFNEFKTILQSADLLKEYKAVKGTMVGLHGAKAWQKARIRWTQNCSSLQHHHHHQATGAEDTEEHNAAA